ncbi:MAG: hypothetical protein IJ894_00970, partial [Bacteroidales bacterium]|nr:hypothetical protein [Bacteroidales bacterium]
KYFPFDVCYRQEVSPIGPDKNYNNVKSTDMQLRGYNRFFAGDIYIQRYSGCYESIEDRFHIKKPRNRRVALQSRHQGVAV